MKRFQALKGCIKQLLSIGSVARVFVGVLLLTILHPMPLMSQEIIRLTNGEWPPYLSEKLPYYGFASHVVSEAFKAVGIRVEYGFFPWKRSYKYAQDGEDNVGLKWHGTVVWVHTEERAKDFLYSTPVIIDSEVLFHLKSRPLKWKKVEDLEGMRIGGTLHTVYPLFEEAEKRGILTIDRGGNYDVLFKKLLYRNIDAIPQVQEVGRYFLHTQLTVSEREKVTVSPKVVEKREYSLILSKKLPENERLLRLFNEGLDKIHSNGVYDLLYQDLLDDKYNYPLPERFPSLGF